MIDDEGKVTMIDFPQMVSVSHRNAQMYFDRDTDCIFKFFHKRFHLSFHDKDGCDDSDSDVEEDGRPSFWSIEKSAGFLDKELAASGFTRKDQGEIEKFIEGGDEQDTVSSDDEDCARENQHENDDANAVSSILPCLHLEASSDHENEDDGDTDEHPHNSTTKNPKIAEIIHCGDLGASLSGNETGREDGSAFVSHASNINKSETSPEEKIDGFGDDCCTRSDDDDGVPVLTKRLNKQRQRAVAAARGGQRAVISSNSYKDKGGSKASRNSKIQRQSCKSYS